MYELIQLKTLGQLRNPVLIAGFAVRRRAGRLASNTLVYLVNEWAAEPFAKIDPEDFYDFTVRRPNVRLQDSKPVIDWPETTVYLASPPGSERDFILLVGFEPNFNWGTFVNGIVAYMDAAGVKTLVNLRSLLGSVPHTRPAPVVLSSTDLELELQFGVQSRGSKYEGPTDIGGVLSAQVQALRWQTVELSVLQPNYFPRMPNAQASLALIRLLDRAFGTKTPLGSLEEAAESQRKAIDESISSDEATKSTIRELEQAYDTGLERLDFLAPGAGRSLTLPPSEEVVQEVERLFREGGRLGDPGPD